MKKHLLLFTLLFSAIFVMHAQDLSLSWEGETLGDTVTVWGDPSVDLVFHAIVHNNTNEDLRVLVSRKRLHLVENTLTQFCWATLCYASEITQSPDTVTIQAGGETEPDSFSGHYLNWSGEIGTTVVEYTFFNAFNPDQKLVVICNYHTSPTGIADEAMQEGSISEIYPNPATGVVYLDLKLTPKVKTAEVRLINVLGSVVRETEIQQASNKAMLDVSNLENGIYFYSVIINGEVYATKKLIVKH